VVVGWEVSDVKAVQEVQVVGWSPNVVGVVIARDWDVTDATIIVSQPRVGPLPPGVSLEGKSAQGLIHIDDVGILELDVDVGGRVSPVQAVWADVSVVLRSHDRVVELPDKNLLTAVERLMVSHDRDPKCQKGESLNHF